MKSSRFWSPPCLFALCHLARLRTTRPGRCARCARTRRNRPVSQGCQNRHPVAPDSQTPSPTVAEPKSPPTEAGKNSQKDPEPKRQLPGSKPEKIEPNAARRSCRPRRNAARRNRPRALRAVREERARRAGTSRATCHTASACAIRWCQRSSQSAQTAWAAGPIPGGLASDRLFPRRPAYRPDWLMEEHGYRSRARVNRGLETRRGLAIEEDTSQSRRLLARQRHHQFVDTLDEAGRVVERATFGQRRLLEQQVGPVVETRICVILRTSDAARPGASG
jgi:hypothetical protein